MKIDYAIVSSDSNPMYLDFWPIVKNLWSNVIKIKPILALISDRDLIIDNGDHIIHQIKSVDGVSTAFQSQIVRMYITKYYRDSICITSDIDMLPLSYNYFNDIVRGITDDKIAILSSDAYTTVRYPLCYNVAKGSLFTEILDLECNFKEYCNRLLKFEEGWDTDELYFGRCINNFKDKNKVVFLQRGWTNGLANNRIDRAFWNYDINILVQGNYIDCHSLRPYSLYRKEIDKLISFLIYETEM